MRLRLILVGFFFALMSAYVGASGYFTASYFGAASDPGWQVMLDGRIQTFGRLSEADVSALRDGDEIAALDGREFRYVRQYFETFARVPPGSPYTVVVRRDGREERLTLRTAPHPFWVRANAVLIQMVVPLAFLLTGLAVFLLRPNDKRAVLLALMLGMFAAALPPVSFLLAHVSGWVAALLTAAHLIGASFFAVTLHFFLIFPESSPVLRRFPRLEYQLYPPFVLTVYPFVAISAFRMATGPEHFQEVQREFPSLFVVSFSVAALYLLGGLLSLAVSYREANEPSRRKLRVVLAGAAAGFLPFLAVNAAFFALEPPLTPLWTVLIVAGHLALALVPLSFAYAIVRHRVIPVSLIVRRGVQYLLAKNALRLLLALPLAGLALTILSDPHRTLADILLRNSGYSYLLAGAGVLLGLVYRRRLNEWVDKKFFREHYDRERILRELIGEVKGCETLTGASRLVSAKVESALHPERLYLFYREGVRGDLSLSYTSGDDVRETARLPESFQLLRLAELRSGAQDFPPPPGVSLPQCEKDWLASLGARLVVPLTGTDGRLSGLFVLGDKKSEVPYTARDRELLESVAAQVALVYENLRLKDRVDQDRRERREVLSRFAGRSLNLLKECPRCGLCFDGAAETCDRDGGELTLTLPVERTIEGRYRLERLAGRGGMGAVYEATDTRLSRQVAVKILAAGLFGDAAALRRFEREAQSAARLAHPNVIAVHDYGRLATEGAFLVMDFARGESLSALLRREGRVGPRRAARLFEQILEGLKAAHAAGVIHRDLKPDNVLVSEPDPGRLHVRLLDFGLAKLREVNPAASQRPTAVTAPGLVMGTFGYMPPEQLLGGEADERSDLFAVGVMAYEALAGRRPFRGRTPVELLRSMQHDLVRLPGEAGDEGRLTRVLRKSLAASREERFASADEMRRELIPALRDHTLPPAERLALEAETVILRDTSPRPPPP